MITKSIVEQLRDKWANVDYLKPVSMVSSPERDSSVHADAQPLPLVDTDIIILDFDKITKALYNGNCPPSADGMFLTKNKRGKINKLYLVEFKSGFYNKTPNDTDEYMKRRKSETDQLLDSIKSKAIHSYVTLEKEMLSYCTDETSKINLYFMVVIDAGGGDDYDGSRDIQRVEDCLSHFHLKHDGKGNDYYYDSIVVKSAQQFKDFIELLSETDKILFTTP